MKKTINKYIAGEIINPFILGLFILTFVLLMFQILKLTEWVVTYGVSLTDVGRLISYILPPFFVFTVPMSFLLAVLLAFARLSADSELIALRASGVSLYQLYPVVGILSLLTAALAMFLTIYAEPWGKNSLKEFIFELAHKKATIGLKEHVFNTDFDKLVIYVNKVDPKKGKIEGVFIADEQSKNKSEHNMVFAKEGQLITDPVNLSLTLKLSNGSIHRRSQGAGSYEVAGFRQLQYPLELAKKMIRDTKKTHMEMSISELKEFIRTQKIKAQETGEEKHWYQYHRAHVEYHKKFAFPLAAIIFGFLGIPLAISPVRSGRSRGFMLALGVLMVYYLMFRVGETIGWKGVVHPAVVMWAPNVFLCLIGLVLFIRKANETEVQAISRYDRFMEWIKAKTGGGR